MAVFRSIWMKTLRDYRVAIMGWGIGLGLVITAVYATARDAIRADIISSLADMFRFLADPVALDTVPGYVTFRGLSMFVPVLLSIWAVLTGAGLLRTEEERGSLDILLSMPRSRLGILVEKLVALILALLLIALIVSLFTVVGQVSAEETIDFGRALLMALNVSLFALLFAAVALFLSQLARWRSTAAGWAGGLLALSFVIDGTGRVTSNSDWIRYLSPFYYYGANKPLIPSQPLDFGAAALLAVVCMSLIVVSAQLFLRRDIGGVALAVFGSSRAGARNDASRVLAGAWRGIWVRTVGLRTLRAHAVPILSWALGTVIFAAWITMLIPTLQAPFLRLLNENPAYGQLFNAQNLDTSAILLSSILFLITPAVVVLFIFTQSLTWSSDVDNGRLELVLSTPQPRERVLLEHFLVVCVATVLAVTLFWLGVLFGAQNSGVSVDTGRVAGASFGMVPLALIAAGLVYALAGRLRHGAITGIVGFFIAASYFVEFFRVALKLPDWLTALSIFHQYGSPITNGLAWSSFFAMLGIAVMLVVIGIMQFRNVDLPQR